IAAGREGPPGKESPSWELVCGSREARPRSPGAWALHRPVSALPGSEDSPVTLLLPLNNVCFMVGRGLPASEDRRCAAAEPRLLARASAMAGARLRTTWSGPRDRA